MSNLRNFLNPAVAVEPKEVFVSKRFQDENGKVVLFKIRPISQEENERMAKASTHRTKTNSGIQEHFDRMKYIQSMIVAATVDPDFTDSELCNAYGTLDPMQVPGKMLLAGEYQRLSNAIAELSGIDDEFAEEEAKN